MNDISAGDVECDSFIRQINIDSIRVFYPPARYMQIGHFEFTDQIQSEAPRRGPHSATMT